MRILGSCNRFHDCSVTVTSALARRKEFSFRASRVHEAQLFAIWMGNAAILQTANGYVPCACDALGEGVSLNHVD